MQWNDCGILIICIPTLLFSAVSDPVFGELYHPLYVFLPPGGLFLSFFESAFRSLQYYFFPRVLWKYILYLKKKKINNREIPFQKRCIFFWATCLKTGHNSKGLRDCFPLRSLSPLRPSAPCCTLRTFP